MIDYKKINGVYISTEDFDWMGEEVSKNEAMHRAYNGTFGGKIETTYIPAGKEISFEVLFEYGDYIYCQVSGAGLNIIGMFRSYPSTENLSRELIEFRSCRKIRDQAEEEEIL